MRNTLARVKFTFFYSDSNKNNDYYSSPLSSINLMNRISRRAVLVTPAMIMRIVTNLPKMLVGTMSPYPTVAWVTTTKYRQEWKEDKNLLIWLNKMKITLQ